MLAKLLIIAVLVNIYSATAFPQEVLVPGWTDNLDMIKRRCYWLAENGLANYPLHFSRFHPEFKLTQLSATPIGILTKAREIALAAGIKYAYIGNVECRSFVTSANVLTLPP